MLRKSTFREIRTSLARYLAIFAIVALGVGFFSGLKDCKESMESTARKYLDETNFFDYQILSSYGADDDSVALAESWDGVSGAEGSIQIDVMARSGDGDSKALKAISLPEGINKLRVTEGRLPENPEECVVDAYSITDAGFRVGDSIEITDENDKDKRKQFKVKEFKIVGLVNTPIYLDYQRGSTDIGNGSLDTFFFIEKDAFDVDYYTNLYVTLKGDEVSLTEEHEDMLKDQEDNMEALAEAVTDGRRETARKDAQDELDEKKQEYEDSLAEYESEKRKAEKEIDDAEDQIESGKRTIASKRQEANSTISDLGNNKKELNDTVTGLEETISGLESNKKKLEKGISEAKAGKKQLEDGISKAKAGKKQLENGIAEAKAGKKQVEDAIAAPRANLQAQLDQVQAALEADPGNTALLEQAETLKAQIAGLDAQVTAVDEQIADLETQLAGVNGQIKGLETELTGVNGTIKELDKNLGKVNDGLAQAKDGKAQAEDGIGKIDEGLKQAEDGLAELDDREADLVSSERTLDQKKREADSEFERAEKELDDAKDKLDEAQEKIDDMEEGNSYALSRTENVGYASFDSNSSIVSNIAKIFPLFFFLIAALVCMTTMTRMVDEQRTQIGVLKALGYSNSQIVGKYMFYSGSAAFLGALVGFFAGCKVFPMVIWNAYTMMYDFSHTVDYIINYKLGLAVLAVAMLCSMGATWVSIAADFKVPPAELIRPKTPTAGKRILLERITPLWNRISFLYKVSIRNIFRDKKRFLMMVIGVSGCTALLIAGIGIRATISKVADYQFDEISLYDVTVMFSKNMTEKRQKAFMKEMTEDNDISEENVRFLHRGEVTMTMGGKTTDITCVATEAEGFGDFVDLHHGNEHIDYPGPGEIVIVRKTNHDYGVDVGDEVKLRDGYREMTAKIVGVADNYVYDSIYMTTDTYREGFGKEPDIKAAYINFEDGTEEKAIRNASADAAGYEYTAAAQTNIDVRENVSRMMKSLNAIVYVVILSAALLAFIVLYNLTNINITERIREIATIKVLGFYQIEVSQYVFRENIFLTAVAAIVGIPMGDWLLKFVIDNIVLSMIYFEPRHGPYDIPIAVALTFVFAFLVNIAMQKRLRNVSMTESLKSVE
ncbi:MAG: FtsX-like permease family protein [Clostridiales bacterium]|nr:FtsX-like permease family protein [Clostridiales bacterium]